MSDLPLRDWVASAKPSSSTSSKQFRNLTNTNSSSRLHFSHKQGKMEQPNLLVKEVASEETKRAPLPSVLAPNTQLSDLSYKSAIVAINKQTGPLLTTLRTLPDRRFTIVLYNPTGGPLMIHNGVLLKTDVSVAYLITLLQMYLDQSIVKGNYDDSLVVESIKIRFGNKEENERYPALRGRPWFDNVNGIQAASLVVWEVGTSELEAYWKAYRSMIQVLGSNDQEPMFKVHTVRLASPSKTVGRIYGKEAGSGHYFKQGTSMTDAKQYFAEQGDNGSLLTSMGNIVVRELDLHPHFQQSRPTSHLGTRGGESQLGGTNSGTDYSIAAADPLPIPRLDGRLNLQRLLVDTEVAQAVLPYQLKTEVERRIVSPKLVFDIREQADIDSAELPHQLTAGVKCHMVGPKVDFHSTEQVDTDAAQALLPSQPRTNVEPRRISQNVVFDGTAQKGRRLNITLRKPYIGEVASTAAGTSVQESTYKPRAEKELHAEFAAHICRGCDGVEHDIVSCPKLRDIFRVKGSQCQDSESLMIFVTVYNANYLAEGHTSIHCSQSWNENATPAEGDLDAATDSAIAKEQTGQLVDFTADDGDTYQVYVPSKPPLDTNSTRNWNTFQTLGGYPDRHKAFPLGHVPFEESQFSLKDLVGAGRTPVSDALAKLSLKSEDLQLEVKTPTAGNHPNGNLANSVAMEEESKEAGKLPAHIQKYWDELERQIGFGNGDEFVTDLSTRNLPAHESLDHKKHYSSHQRDADVKHGLQLVNQQSGNKVVESSQKHVDSLGPRQSIGAPSRVESSTDSTQSVNAGTLSFLHSAADIPTGSALNVNAPSFESPTVGFATLDLNASGNVSPRKNLGRLNFSTPILQAPGRSASPAFGSLNVNALSFRATPRSYSPGLIAARANPSQPYIASQSRLRSRSPAKSHSTSPTKIGPMVHMKFPNTGYHSTNSSVDSVTGVQKKPSYGTPAGGYGAVSSLSSTFNPDMFQYNPQQRQTSQFVSRNMFSSPQMASGRPLSPQQSQHPFYQGPAFGSQQHLSQYGSSVPKLDSTVEAWSQKLEVTRRIYPSQTVNQALHASGPGLFSTQGQGQLGQSFNGQGRFSQQAMYPHLQGAEHGNHASTRGGGMMSNATAPDHRNLRSSPERHHGHHDHGSM